MAHQRIEKLTLSNFRGSVKPTELEFKPDKNVVLIFGENGTGKSSIVDAIDFVCNSEFGSVGDCSGTTARTHVVSLNAAANELEVRLTFGGKEWRATLDKSTPRTTPQNPPNAFVLRRADITKVMEATPAERHKALQAFITVSHVERAEATLRQAAKDAQQDLARTKRDREVASQGLARFWQAEGCPNGDALTWAKAKTTEETSVLRTRLEHCAKLLERFRQTQDLRNNVREVALSAKEARRALDESENALRGTEKIGPLGDVQLYGLLVEAQTFIRSSQKQVETCPVCGNAESGSALLQRIEQNLSRMAHLRQLLDDRNTKQSNLDDAVAIRESRQQSYIESCHKLAGNMAGSPSIFVGKADVSILAQVSDDTPSLLAARTVLEDLVSRESVLKDAIDEDQKTLNLMTSLCTYLETIELEEAAMRDQQAIAERLDAIFAVVERERKRYVANLMRAIGEEVNSLYARIHPNEQIGKSSITVKRGVARSLELKAQFADKQDIPPGAYYSESHLDTLGLCIYLAMAKHSGASHNIVVLDDVLGSVDEVHLQRILEILAEEASMLGHLVITTHSRSLYDLMRQSNGLNADRIELYGWDIEHGIRHSRTPLAVDALREVFQKQPLDRQAAASKAGILLEYLLNALALRYELLLPRKKEGGWTLGELGGAIDKGLGKLLASQQTIGDGEWQNQVMLKPLIMACTDNHVVRNQVGAHFNTASSQISDGWVREFVQNVLNLADTLICNACGQLPARDKSGAYWECGGGCGKTRLHPLRTPNN